MISEKFLVNNEPERIESTRLAAEAFAAKLALDKRSTLRLNLLVEETLGMVKAMVDDFYGQLWLEGKGKHVEIHLQATTEMDSGKKDELLSVSSTGRNAAVRGFMGMIGEVISNALHGFGRAMDAYGEESISTGAIWTSGVDSPSEMLEMTPLFTLSNYKEILGKERDADARAEEALEDLEKSIVARLADEVIVGVKKDRIEMAIIKEF